MGLINYALDMFGYSYYQNHRFRHYYTKKLQKVEVCMYCKKKMWELRS
jgi:hypothetical protein